MRAPSRDLEFQDFARSMTWDEVYLEGKMMGGT